MSEIAAKSLLLSCFHICCHRRRRRRRLTQQPQTETTQHFVIVFCFKIKIEFLL